MRPQQRREAFAAALGVVLGMLGALPQPAFAQTPAAVSSALPSEVLVLRVFLNSADKGDLFVHRNEFQGFFLKIDDLKAMGLREPPESVVVIDGESHLALASIKGMTFSFDPKTLVLSLVAEPQLLRSSAISLRDERRQLVSTAGGNSAFFNYALTSTGGNAASNIRLGLAGELGVRWGEYLLLSDAVTVASPNSRRLVRLMSSITTDDRENLNRLVIGDFLAPSRDFGNSMNLGGISFSKAYGLDPGFIRFPARSVSGSVASPSELEVYLDGQRIRTEKLAPGNFQLQDIVAYGGARNVQLLVRDGFGRVQQLNYSVYFSDQPLQSGLHDYSYNLGAIRRQYGLQSNNYGPVAFTMFHRFGFSDVLTMGWRADVTKDLVNTGPSATAVLGNFGVVNLALAGSNFSGTKGYAVQGSYSYESKDWAFSLFGRHDSGQFASLGDPVALSSHDYEANLTGTYRLPHNASISASRSQFKARQSTATSAPLTAVPSLFFRRNRSVSSFSYAAAFAASRTQLTVSVNRIKEDVLAARNELFVGLNFSLDGGYSLATNYRADRDGHAESIRFNKGLPVGEGLGYDLSVDQSTASSSNRQIRSSVQYNAPVATFRFEQGQYSEQGQKSNEQRISLAGAVASVGGELGFSRPIAGSYAIVKVGQEKGVAVLVDGQNSGVTNSRGAVVLSNLNANYENSISIDSDALPLNLSLSTALKKVVPAFRSGVLVDFDPKKTQAFSGKLVASSSGNPRGVEFFEMDILVSSVPRKLVTGRGGEFYAENIPAGTYQAKASNGSASCSFFLTFPASDEILVDLGTIACVLQSVRK